MEKWKSIVSLVLINFVYSLEPILAKVTSKYELCDWRFYAGIASVVFVLGIYAIAWQQILKKVELSMAYMFKGLSIIFVLLLSFFLFQDNISPQNIIGSLIIIGGIILFAK